MLASKKNSVSVGGSRKASVDGSRRASYAFSPAPAPEDSSYTLQSKIATMREDLARSQESFISRERAYRTRIGELEDEFARVKNRKTGWMRSSGLLSQLREAHQSINENVELVQSRTSQIVSAQEAFMVGAFRARLLEIQAELEKEKGKADDGSVGWIEKGHALEAQVEALKEAADLLERLNQGLAAENAELAARRRSREAERLSLAEALAAERDGHAALQEQLAAARQTHAGLREQLRRMQDEAQSVGLDVGGGGALPRLSHHGSVNLLGTAQENEERQREANKRVRRLLGEERRSLVLTQQDYARELAVRTDLELLLRGYADQVGRELSRRQVEERRSTSTPSVPEQSGESRPPPLSAMGLRAYSVLHDAHGAGGASPLVTPSDQFSKADRDRVLELMFSDPAVMQQLCRRRSPRKGRAGASTQAQAALSPEQAGPSDEPPPLAAAEEQPPA